ncbi:ribosomal oxygenase 1 [Neodiprion pinetum]|uniref:Bifunctional lysine-specific demethylase and histidyl-hydroxylase n=1 Tax=Neodiprion lecontei TaxID=441921 RepID=A0A6J0BV95_NEOLC|nr:ribosomal oxygenase 1 [Neodiprion lecontei]XP_046486850.1 ribosomal oxygenase 1 [Neodiprion pinetum]XP_046486851.1 ribosomal oxygenase 1 [Neodiprion pinetum]XP_046599451.1 ribosomal oxygenase 1 [Neodiprion lecontei]
MSDTSTSISAFAAYSKMRQTPESPFSSKPAKKRHSSAALSSKKKPRKRSASVGDLTPNEKGKKTQKMSRLLKEKSMKTATGVSKKSSSNSKSTVKRLSNGIDKSSSKSATPNNRRSVAGKSKAAFQLAVAESEVSPKLRNKTLRSSGDKTELKAVVKKVTSPVNSAPKKKASKKSPGNVAKSKPESDSEKAMSDVDESELQDKEETPSGSIDDGKKLFEWLISPLQLDAFYKTSWELAPLYIKRNTSSYYKHLISTPLIDSILRNYYMQFTKNVDVTSYTDGKRETHNPVGRALPSVVWDYYANGCSVRLLNPQTFIPKLHVLNATLQEYFGCFVGANAYLTPPNTQGFAPHYDDIEAFILQVEGKKRWRLYKPRSDDEYLPRLSSDDFDQSEIGEPIMDIVLETGDLLYFPRGTIHQGETIDDTHSLHVTLSVYQRNSWGDFFDKLVPVTLEKAIASDVEFREGLPLDYLQHVGLAHADTDTIDRTKFIRRTQYLLSKLVQYIDVDRAADEMAKKHIHDFLPPVLTEEEKACSIYEDGERMTKGGIVVNRIEVEPDTKIRLARAYCIRLLREEDGLKVYYSTENSKEYRELDPQFLEVSQEHAPAIEEIIRQYPNYIKVEDLPLDEEDSKIQVVRDLWERGILVTDQPLPIVE